MFRGLLIFVPSYLLGLGIGVVLLLLFKRRSGVGLLQSLELLAPLVVWEILSEFVGPGGTLSNALAEPFYLGLVGSATQGLRLIAPGSTRRQIVWRFQLSVLLCVLVGVIFALSFPDLPE